MGVAGTAVVTFNVIPSPSYTLKYERLGPVAMETHRRYCQRHGYRFLDRARAPSGRPACWGKIPAVLDALRSHEWVLWADSDALVWSPAQPLDALVDEPVDLVVQSPVEHFAMLGVDPAGAFELMPLHTGVVLVRSTPWSQQLLRDAYDQTLYIGAGGIWNGVGDQEAVASVLQHRPSWRDHVRYVDDLVCHPRLATPDRLFVHLYGNHARHRFPMEVCDEVIARWELAVAQGGRLPSDIGRFHWCCIQNKDHTSPVDLGGPEQFLYAPSDVDGSDIELSRRARA